MPSPKRPPGEDQKIKDTFERYLAEGYSPPGFSSPKGSAFTATRKELALNPGSLVNWLAAHKRRFDAGKPNFYPELHRYRPSAARAIGTTTAAAPAKAARYLLTAAQDETPVHAPFWNNLMAFAAWIGAEVRVGGFTYQKALFEDHAARSGVFASEVQPFLSHERLDLGELLFCAEMNTLPTAVRPLSGLETYTAGRWGVFPHAKVQLISVPTMQDREPAQLMTTGACTVANYIAKKAGQKAEFHHVIGATLVEIDSEGRTFCRQINATDDGSFQDLDVKVSAGRVTSGHRVEAITYGDIHRPKIDPAVAMAIWGLDVERDVISRTETMLDALRPKHQFFHDLLDFMPRNHHRRGDHAFAFRMAVEGKDSVDGENRLCSRFLRLTARDWSTSVVVPSNHNEALPRWLKEADPRQDPINLPFWCSANVAIYDAISRADREFDVVRWALARHDERGLEDVVFVPRNASYVICQEHGGIECSLHGDAGPDGARGTPSNLARVAVRMNIGHGHSPAIIDGVYRAGLCGLLDQEYNVGPSAWSHTQIVTYPNSKRTLVTIRDGKWRA